MQKAKEVSAGKGSKILQLDKSQQTLHILSLFVISTVSVFMYLS